MYCRAIRRNVVELNICLPGNFQGKISEGAALLAFRARLSMFLSARRRTDKVTYFSTTPKPAKGETSSAAASVWNGPTIFDTTKLMFDVGEKANESLYLCDPSNGQMSQSVDQGVQLFQAHPLWSKQDAKQLRDDQRWSGNTNWCSSKRGRSSAAGRNGCSRAAGIKNSLECGAM